MNFQRFLDELLPRLTEAYGHLSNQVRIHIHAPDVSLPINEAIPCGLIVNELVSNALKHGFPKGRTGTIKISYRSNGADWSMSVTDDGVGFGVVPSDGTGLGLQTIRERLKLLHGDAASLHIGANSPSGVIATITVPYQLSK